jgi:hypothetical protein
MEIARARLTTRIEIVVARLVMLVTAAGLSYTGYAILTQPVAIPVAIVLWFGAISIAALGVCGPVGDDDAGAP